MQDVVKVREIKNMIEKRCANFIMCTNSRCKNYWEDMCTENIENKIVHFNSYGICEDYKRGVSKWYEQSDTEE